MCTIAKKEANNNIMFTIQDYENMIFAIEMQDFIFQKDYTLIRKYKKKIKELSEVK